MGESKTPPLLIKVDCSSGRWVVGWKLGVPISLVVKANGKFGRWAVEVTKV